MSDVIHGACLCGKIAFDVSNSNVMGACHCTRCQRWTGSGNSMVIVTEPKDFKVTKGQELLKQFHEDGFSDRFFCTNCGSGLYVQGSDGKLYVSAGNMKDLKLKPGFHIQVAYKAPLEDIGGNAPQFPEWPTS